MKKLALALVAFFATFATISTTASAVNIDLTTYPGETLEESFNAEGITYDFTNSSYSDSGDKPTLYVFRLSGCINCKNFYNFIRNELLANYAEKFKVISYELTDPLSGPSYDLLKQFGAFFNESVTSVKTPIVIIGNTMSTGAVDDARKDQIIDLINSDTDYDVINEINDGITNINDSMKKEFTATSDNITLTTTTPFYRTHTLNTTATDASSIKLDKYEYISAHDIAFMNGSTPVALSNTNLTIRIPVGKIYKTYKVAYINNGQISEILDAKYQNGFVIFNTSHLSEYAIYGSNTETLTAIDTTQTSNANTVKKAAATAPNGGTITTTSGNAIETTIISLILTTTAAGLYITYRNKDHC